MTTVTQEINANVAQPNNLQFINAMQGDYDTMYIKVTVYDGNELYNIDCTSVMVKGVTANGAAIYKAVDSYDTNTVTFILSDNMLASAGAMELSLVFISSDSQLSTFPMTIIVRTSPTGEVSESEIDWLKQLLAEAAEQAELSEAYATLSQSYAVGGTDSRDGEDTDNAKYYAEQSAKSAEQSSSYADSASASVTTAAESATSAASSAAASAASATKSATSATQSAASATSASESADDAKDYASLSESYAHGGTGTRDDEDTDNAKYYYEQMSSNMDSTLLEIVDKYGIGDSNIYYFDTYAEFKTEFDAGNIDTESLVLIGEVYTDDESGDGTSTSIVNGIIEVTVKSGTGVSRSSGGAAVQGVVSGKSIKTIIYVADNGYYFPTSYSVSSANGISVTRNNYTQITVSGTPTADTVLTLTDATEKASVDAPSVTATTGAISGTTTAMEYATSSTATAWTTCLDGTTAVEDGTYYVRYAETDTTLASDSTSVTIISAISNLSVTSVTETTATVSYTLPSTADSVMVYAYTSSSVSSSTYTTSAASTSSTCTISGLSSGTTYYFVVYAISNNTYSTISNVVSSTTTVAVSAITDFSYTQDGWVVDFTWTLPTNASYTRIYYYTDSALTFERKEYDKEYYTTTKTVNLYYGDAGNTVYFVIYAYDESGNASASSNVLSITAPSTLTCPSDITITGTTSTSVTFSYSAEAWNSFIYIYAYTDSTVSDSVYSTYSIGIFNYTAKHNQCIIDGLSPNTTYYFRAYVYDTYILNTSSIKSNPTVTIKGSQLLNTTTESSISQASVISNGGFVAMGTHGSAAYSPDGKNWLAASGTSDDDALLDVVQGSNRLVAVGELGVSYYSTNGYKWTTMSGLDSSYDYTTVQYLNGTYVTIGINNTTTTSLADSLFKEGSIIIYYSTSGTKWTQAAAYDDYYYICGNQQTFSYESMSLGYQFGNPCAIYNDMIFFTAFYSTDIANVTPVILYSSDGKTWSELTSDVFPARKNDSTYRYLTDIFIPTENYLFLVTGSTMSDCLVSADGLTWSSVDTDMKYSSSHAPLLTRSNCAYIEGSNRLVIVSDDKTVAYSTSQSTFNYSVVDNFADLYLLTGGSRAYLSMTQTDNYTICIAANGCWYTTDGLTWTKTTVNTPSVLANTEIVSNYCNGSDTAAALTYGDGILVCATNYFQLSNNASYTVGNDVTTSDGTYSPYRNIIWFSTSSTGATWATTSCSVFDGERINVIKYVEA